jgi:threonine/homoserine/homoserine lactone efflux protein
MTPAQNFRAAAFSLLVVVFIVVLCCLSGCQTVQHDGVCLYTVLFWIGCAFIGWLSGAGSSKGRP